MSLVERRDDPDPEPRRTSRRDSRRESRWDHAQRTHDAGWLLLGTYALGPLGLLLDPIARKNLAWTGIAVFSGLAWTILALRGVSLMRAETHPVTLMLVLGLLVVASILGGIAWSRAIWFGADSARRSRRWPPPGLSFPPLAFLASLVAPGLGFALAHRPGRAAFTVLGIPSLVASLLVLWRSQGMWQAMATASPALRLGLEAFFIASGAVALVGTIAWVAQALDGTVQVAGREGPRPLGTQLALGLLVSIVALMGFLNPHQAARNVDGVAQGFQIDGYTILPVQLSRLAVILDPGEPLYGLHLADRYEAQGDVMAARSIRRDLHERWSVVAEAGVPQRRRPERMLTAYPDPPDLAPGHQGPDPAVTPRGPLLPERP